MDKGRVRLSEEVQAWRHEHLEQGVVEIPIDGEIGVLAANLTGFHTDPADRLIVATTLTGHRLVTSDRTWLNLDLGVEVMAIR